jgi:lysophospholipase
VVGSVVVFERRFLAFDQTPIFYRQWIPAAKPKALILVVHGMGEHGGRYEALANFLGEMDCALWIPDLRGFGRSGGQRAYIRSFEEYHKDLLALHGLMFEEFHGVPIFILGHSLGGLIASSYTAFMKRPPQHGLILSSPCFGVTIQIPFIKHWLGMISAWVAPRITQRSGLNPKALTHDGEIVAQYEKDPLVTFRVSSRLYSEIMKYIRWKNEIASLIKCPTLILQAGLDVIVSKEATRSFFDHLSAESKEFELYEENYHEVLNELNRTQIFTRIGAWIDKHRIV